jgi:hypothetical protein
MVVGNGMIAKRFSSYTDDNKWLVFASGVSHSLSNSPEEFEREKKTPGKQHSNITPGKTLVYFSTCSIYDPSLHHSAYVLHKLRNGRIDNNGLLLPIISSGVSNPVGKQITTTRYTIFFVAQYY